MVKERSKGNAGLTVGEARRGYHDHGGKPLVRNTKPRQPPKGPHSSFGDPTSVPFDIKNRAASIVDNELIISDYSVVIDALSDIIRRKHPGLDLSKDILKSWTAIVEDLIAALPDRMGASVGTTNLDTLLDRLAERRGIAREHWKQFKRDVLGWKPHKPVGRPNRALETALPETAPYIYAERASYPDLAGLDIVSFLREVWGPWIRPKTPKEVVALGDQVLSRLKLRALDRSAEKAVQNWLLHKPLPADIYLPTLEQLNDAILAVDDGAHLRLARRVISMAHRRRPEK